MKRLKSLQKADTYLEAERTSVMERFCEYT